MIRYKRERLVKKLLLFLGLTSFILSFKARAETYRAVDDRSGGASEQSWIFQKRDLSFSDSEDQVDDPYSGIPVRLSTPEDAKTRLVVEDTNEMVPMAIDAAENVVMAQGAAPEGEAGKTNGKESNRSIASVSSALPLVEKKLVSKDNLKSKRGAPLRIENPIPESARERVMGLQEVSLIAADNGFFPKHITVTQGVPVRVYLSTPSKNTLCFVQDQLNLRKGVAPGGVAEITFVAERAGNYRFYCPVKSLEGTLTVLEPVDAASTVPVSRITRGDTVISTEDIDISATSLVPVPKFQRKDRQPSSIARSLGEDYRPSATAPSPLMVRTKHIESIVDSD